MLKKICNIFKRDPCKECIVKACCKVQCSDYKIYSQKYDVIIMPFFITILTGITICIIIPFAFMLVLFEELGIIKTKSFEQQHY